MQSQENSLPPHIFVSPPIRPTTPFDRADIVIEGFDQAGPSFEARIFLNNPAADETTPLDADSGYAGTLHIYGGGGDPTRTERLPMTRSMPATGAVQQALRDGSELTVTVVAVPQGAALSPGRAGLALDLDRVSIATDTTW